MTNHPNRSRKAKSSHSFSAMQPVKIKGFEEPFCFGIVEAIKGDKITVWMSKMHKAMTFSSKDVKAA